MTTASNVAGDRAVDPAQYAIGGTAPRFAARPTHRDELCELLRAATRDGFAVVPWGGGTDLDRERRMERYDLAIDLTALDRVVEYEPEDLTLTAECGITLAILRARLAARGQELPIEAPQAIRATLGGALASNASGPRRLRFGGPRDRILGARFVLGDGTLVRTGGKVVKNVAGYGIHRLLCGSRGGLAILVDVSLKLLPGPAARVAMAFRFDADALAHRDLWAGIPATEPAVFTAVGATIASGLKFPEATANSVWIVLGFEDDASRTAELEAMITKRFGVPALRWEGDAAETLWQQLADLSPRSPRLMLTSAHNTPVGIATLAGTPELLDNCVFHAAGGRLHLSTASAEQGRLVEGLSEAGFSLIGSRGSEVLPAIPPAQATRALRRRIRAALDPGRRFAFGEAWEQGTG